MPHRPEKVANEIKRILAQPIVDISNSIKAGFATLTAVRISKDLQNAKLYISLFGKNSQPGKLIDELENQRGELRHIIAKDMRLKSVPDLKFYLDDTLDQIEHIQSLLNSVKSSNTDDDNFTQSD
ncbi:MAG: 30S ribosome-binding factor RbfA [Candidatus Kapabacteria bacterium]|nr:30S ribosome-binding factor RbfA [Ignavibacteriota bacterium]MCW5884414.1 30S ribosome-binding factor RbfA [Candidatus Kapabacteria bacterium]